MIKEIINFCKDLEGLEAEHNDLSVIGIPSQKLTKQNKKVAQTLAEFPKKRKIFTPCPIHLESDPLHSMEDCETLKQEATVLRKLYVARRKTPRKGKKVSFKKPNEQFN